MSVGPLLGYGGAGVGLSMLENNTLLEDQPDSIKHINAVLGGVTGATFGAGNPETKALAALSWPVKQLALLGVGKAEQFRQDQAGLLDKKLRIAETEQQTARVNQDAAGGNKALLASFLVPAILGGGGLAYYAYNKRKKDTQGGRYSTLDERGPHQPAKKRIRIDVPTSALPDDFFDTLVTADDNPRSRVQLQELRPNGAMKKRSHTINDEDMPAYRRMWHNYTQNPWLVPDRSKPETLPRQIAGLAGEFTGVPSLWRGVKDIGEAGDAVAESRHDDAMRYGMAGTAGLVGGVSAVNMGTPWMLSKVLKRDRVRTWMNQNPATRVSGLKAEFTRPKGLANWIYNRTWRNETDPGIVHAPGTARHGRSQADMRGSGSTITRPGGAPAKNLTTGARDRARNIKYRYNPDLLAWDRGAVDAKYQAMNAARSAKGMTEVATPQTKSWLFNNLLTARKGPKPMGSIGGALDLARFGANRAVNLGYRGAMLARRNPNMTAMLASMPFLGMGLEHDKTRNDSIIDHMRQHMPTGHQAPAGISGTLSNLLNITGAQPLPGITQQMR